MDQRPPSKSASQAEDHMQSWQKAEADSVQDQEKAWYPNKLQGGSNIGDQHPKKNQLKERRQRHSKLNPKCWMKKNWTMCVYPVVIISLPNPYPKLTIHHI